jgi:Domain of unknown function (DUF5060)/Putative collagen-binding domain of a collagenase
MNVRARLVGVALVLAVAGLGTPGAAYAGHPKVPLYGIFEAHVANPTDYENPFDYRVIELRTRFVSPSGRVVRFLGFYNGDGAGGQAGDVWTLRFMPDEVGRWSYSYTWSDGRPGGSGNFDVKKSKLPGPLRVARDNSWYFMDSRGRKFDWRGYGFSGWFGYPAPGSSGDTNRGWFFDEPGTTQITTSVDRWVGDVRAAIEHGYNYLYLPGVNNRIQTYPRRAQANRTSWLEESWWITGTTDRFDIPVWTAYERLLRLMNQRGVYAGAFDGMVGQGHQLDSFADFQPFLRYWVARFAAFYNFIGWSPSWEWHDIWEPEEVDQIMQYVHDLDPWKRLLTAHDNSYSTFTGWLGYSDRQCAMKDLFGCNSRRAGQQQIPDPNGSGGVGDPFIDNPVIGSEDVWETFPNTFCPNWCMPENAVDVSRQVWGIMMAGVLPLYSEWGGWDLPPGGDGQGEPVARRMFDFFYDRTRYRQYVQLNELVSQSDGQVASGVEDEEYLVYDWNGGSITVDLSGASGSTRFSVLWYDPLSGATRRRGVVRAGVPVTLASPYSGDSVLLLKGE